MYLRLSYEISCEGLSYEVFVLFYKYLITKLIIIKNFLVNKRDTKIVINEIFPNNKCWYESSINTNELRYAIERYKKWVDL